MSGDPDDHSPYFDDLERHNVTTVRRMRRFVTSLEGRAFAVNTSLIRAVSGLDREEYLYVYDLLAEKDIIETGKDIPPGETEEQNTAELTAKGRDMRRKNVFQRYIDLNDDTEYNLGEGDDEVQELRERVLELEHELEELRTVVTELRGEA